MPDQNSSIPRPTRIELNAPVELRLEDGTEVDAVMLDMSSGGFRLKSSELLQIGERVTIKMEDSDPVLAEIRWANGGEVGGVFLQGVQPL